MKVLIIEDSKKTSEVLEEGLTAFGWSVETHTTASSGIRSLNANTFDVVVLDRMLPGMDGMNALKAMRAAGITTPTLLLTAMSSIQDRVDGLEAGADDYLVKPFAIEELAARLKVICKRNEDKQKTNSLTHGEIKLDRSRRTAFRGSDDIQLSAVEFRILEYLVENAGTAVTKKMLLENIWRYKFDPTTTIVETQMSRLRSKLDKPYPTALIKTIRGVGYLVPEE